MQTLMKLHRMSHALYVKKFRMGSRILDGVIRFMFSASIPGRAEIHKEIFFHHSGIGVVINNASKVEKGCEIGVHVVLGGRSPLPGAPHLGENVIVHAGAKIIGAIKIGSGSIVAANAVVLEDMPENCLIAGVPAVAKRLNIDSKDYVHRPSAV